MKVSFNLKNHEQHDWRRNIVKVRSGTVVITIDLDKIARDVGARALFNKNGKATQAGGAIKCEAIKSTLVTTERPFP